MVLALERLKFPNLIKDIKTIKRNEKNWSIISYGSFVSVFIENEIEIVAKSSIFISGIVVFESGCFLLGTDSYLVCYFKDIQKRVDKLLEDYKFLMHTKTNIQKDELSISVFPKCILNTAAPLFRDDFISHHFLNYPNNFNRVNKVLQSENGLLMFINEHKKYFVGVTVKDRIVFDVTLVDNSFYKVIDSSSLGNYIYLLLGTTTKKFIFSYYLELDTVKSQKKEILHGLSLILRPGGALLVDKEGIYSSEKILSLDKFSIYKEKLNFIKDFGNYKISHSSYDKDRARNILFCKNGEVIIFNKDNTHYTVGYLCENIEGSAYWGDKIVCFSRSATFLIELNKNINIISTRYSVGNNTKLTRLKGYKEDPIEPLLELVSGRSQVIVSSLINLSKIENQECPNLNSKTVRFKEECNLSSSFTNRTFSNNFLKSQNQKNLEQDLYDLAGLDRENNNETKSLQKDDGGLKESLPVPNYLKPEQNQDNLEDDLIGSSLALNCNSDILFSSLPSQSQLVEPSHENIYHSFNPSIKFFKNESSIAFLLDSLSNALSNISLETVKIEDNNILINFNSRSLLNGQPVKKVKAIAQYLEKTFLFIENYLYMIYRGRIYKTHMKSLLTKFYSDIALFYAQNNVFIFDFNDQKFYYKSVEVDVVDIIMQNNYVICLDVNLNITRLSLIDFESSINELQECTFGDISDTFLLTSNRSIYDLSLYGKMSKFFVSASDYSSFEYLAKSSESKNENSYLGKKMNFIDGINTTNHLEHNARFAGNIKDSSEIINKHSSEDSSVNNLDRNGKNLKILAFDGKIFELVENTVVCLFDCKEYIKSYTIFNNYIVAICKNSYCYDILNKRLYSLCITAKCFFALEAKLYLSSNNNLYVFENPSSQMFFKIKNFNLKNGEKLITSYKNSPVYINYSCDYLSVILHYKDFSLKFKNFIIGPFCKLRENEFLLCLNLNIKSCGYSLDNKLDDIDRESESECLKKSNKMKSVLHHIKIEENALKIKKSIFFDHHILAVCAKGRDIAIAHSNSIQLLKVSRGIIFKKREIVCSSFCKDMQFVGKGFLRINNDDWSYINLNTKTKEVSYFNTKGNTFPFNIDEIDGYGLDTKIFISGNIFDVNEKIDQICTTSEGVLIFCKNGSILSLRNKNVEENEVKSIYSSQVNVLNMM